MVEGGGLGSGEGIGLGEGVSSTGGSGLADGFGISPGDQRLAIPPWSGVALDFPDSHNPVVPRQCW